MRVLVIEDYDPLRRSLATALVEEGWAVDQAADGDEGAWAIGTGGHDLIVLDLMLPGRSGLAILSDLRAGGSTTPVLVLTARDAVEDRIAGLNAGADDYMVKPFALGEFLARCRSLTRRAHGFGSDRLVFGRMVVDRNARRVEIDGQPLTLTGREWTLLELLVLRRGSIVNRQEIVDGLWAFDQEASSNAIEVFIAAVRRKLALAGMNGLIHTHRGIGYRFEPCAP